MMRVSRLMLVTLRDVPADAEIASHQLLIRGGFIRRIASGIYAYMPLMWKVIEKIQKIVNQELKSIDCLQTLLPQLHPAELWEKSGRWSAYTKGEGIMFHLKDRQNKELGLGPTHEEVITQIASELINSYKQLPISLYQIQTKFRDEIRPRFGLMRSREFIMKDAYSFHDSESSLKETYNKMDRAYRTIFERCGLSAVPVEADSGSIGGASSQEFMITASSGEDLILTSTDGQYSANEEKAISIAKEALLLEEGKLVTIETKGQKTIAELCKQNEIDETQTVKVVLLLGIFADNEKQPILASIRGDQEINEVKLINYIQRLLNKELISIENISNEKINSQGIGEWPLGYIGPDLSDSYLKNAKSWNNKFLRIIDNTAADLNNFVCGSNEINSHRKYVSWDYLGIEPKGIDLRKAKEGDYCKHNKKIKLEAKRGIEVGHIFQLGTKYSSSLEATFTNKNGKQEPLWMGCYGIGISRLAQAAVEQNHDDSGICWPVSIAPFEIIIIIANIQEASQMELGERIYKELLEKGIDVLLDDRIERAGVKFNDADLIGIPWKIVVGRDAKTDKVEVTKRVSGERILLRTREAIEKIRNEIFPENS